jgi:hypothetical protein
MHREETRNDPAALVHKRMVNQEDISSRDKYGDTVLDLQAHQTPVRMKRLFLFWTAHHR